ncbi:Sulfite efflux pump SSU1 [Cladobotryum mycophilum]|uniref:Sulfite efflux pump SSU1 n=1 Tax=Cladobotryum mycophilum TaxID=491253 RepID=A0ABR0T318_9HYPO
MSTTSTTVANPTEDIGVPCEKPCEQSQQNAQQDGQRHLNNSQDIHDPFSNSDEESPSRQCPANITVVGAKSWFAVNMGTGIVAILLHNLPWNGYWLHVISYIFFVFNILLFITFLIISLLRYTLYPEIWFAMIRHPAQSLFLGCVPMALATIINMMIFSCSQWGPWLIYLAWGLWWFDVLVSMATCISMPFIVWNRHRPGLQNTTAALLLPIVPCIVAAATGGVVASELPNYGHAFTTIIASYILWGIGQALSACVMALYFHRLTVHNLPPKEAIVSVFLPVGPLGQGGFGIQQLGKVSLKVFPHTQVFRVAGVDPSAAQSSSTLATTHKFPFNMGWWGFTFPLGVWATCTAQLWQNLDSEFFKVITMIISLSVVLLWIVVALRTVQLAITGEMFFAPCLKDLRTKPVTKPDCEKADKAV